MTESVLANQAMRELMMSVVISMGSKQVEIYGPYLAIQTGCCGVAAEKLGKSSCVQVKPDNKSASRLQ